MAYLRKSTLNIKASRIFLIPKVLLSPLGLWFGQHVGGGLLSCVTSFAKLATFSLFLFHLMLTAANLAVKKHSLPDLTFMTLVFVRLITTISKIIALDASRKSLRMTIEECFSIKNVPFLLRGHFEEMRKNCSRTPKSLLIPVAWVIFMYSPFWFTSFKTDYPLTIWLPFPEKQFPQFVNYVKKLTSGTLFLMAILNIGTISLFTVMASICKHMLKHMNQVLETLSHPELYQKVNMEPEKLTNDDFYNNKINKTLVYVHKFHLKILGLVACSNRTFSIILMLDVWAMIACHCVLTFSMTRSDLSFESKAAYAFNIIFNNLMFSTACYEAGEVTEESKHIKNRCFGTAWWTFSPDNVYFIKIIGLRSTDAVNYKVGFLNPASLRTMKLPNVFRSEFELLFIQGSIVHT
ncbi:Hypothetical predicted protein [Cloeon dipterum]|uniref:Odorant receptor n=1 Tax=Cloeon dipterum TaxID=197152 RepID=A0A8S1CHI1_9INSE|nr:Hypothetical predicted protein [Cloeon dipterum]